MFDPHDGRRAIWDSLQALAAGNAWRRRRTELESNDELPALALRDSDRMDERLMAERKAG
jgi:hypothetical protein